METTAITDVERNNNESSLYWVGKGKLGESTGDYLMWISRQ